jgi:tetratricopeptide (TPR) repeat protein
MPAAPPASAEQYITLESEGVSQHLAGNYVAAEASFRSAAEIRRQLQGPTHTDLAYSLDLAGWAIYAQGRVGDATRMFELALALCPSDDPRQRYLTFVANRGRDNPPSPDIAFSLEGINTVLIRQNKTNIAFHVSLAAIKHSVVNLPRFHDDLFQHFVDLTEMVYDSSSAILAFEHRLRYSIEDSKIERFKSDLYYCYGILNLADKLAEYGITAEAEELYMEYVNVHQLIQCDNDQNAAHFLYTIGRYAEASQLYMFTNSYYQNESMNDGSASFGLARISARRGEPGDVYNSLWEALTAARRDAARRSRDTLGLIEMNAFYGAFSLSDNHPHVAYARFSSAGDSVVRRTRLRLAFEPAARREYRDLAVIQRDAIVSAWLINDPRALGTLGSSTLERYLQRPPPSSADSTPSSSLTSCMPDDLR